MRAGSPIRAARRSSPCTRRAHFLAQLLDVGSGGRAEIDQEIAVLLGDLRAADLEARGSRRVDQLPRLVAGRIGEGRAAGAAAQGWESSRAPVDPVMRRLDRELVAGAGREAGAEATIAAGRQLAVAIGVAELARPSVTVRPLPQDRRLGRDQHLRDLAAIGAGIGPERAADRAGDAAQELEAGQRRLARASARQDAARTGAARSSSPRPLTGEASPQADHDARARRRRARSGSSRRPSTVTGTSAAAPRGTPRDPSTSAGRNSTLGRGRRSNQVSGAERRIGRQPAARLGQPVDQVRTGRERHHAGVRRSLAMARGRLLGASCWSWPGSACAHAVMLPAPRQTTTSPGRATRQIRPGRSPGAAERRARRDGRARCSPLDQRVAVDALDRRLAGGIDIGDQHDVGIVEAGRETRPSARAAGCSGAAA